MELYRLRSQIERALAYAGGTHTFEDVEKQYLEGRFQVWPGVDSVVITEVLDTPRIRILHVWLTAGNMDELRDLFPRIVEWGKHVGCERAQGIGRRGWARSFLTREQGWSEAGTLFERAIP